MLTQPHNQAVKADLFEKLQDSGRALLGYNWIAVGGHHSRKNQEEVMTVHWELLALGMVDSMAVIVLFQEVEIELGQHRLKLSTFRQAVVTEPAPYTVLLAASTVIVVTNVPTSLATHLDMAQSSWQTSRQNGTPLRGTRTNVCEQLYCHWNILRRILFHRLEVGSRCYQYVKC